MEEVIETRVCEDCEQPRPLTDFREGVDAGVCAPCRYSSLTIGLPRDHRSRTPSKAPPRTPNNSFNKGIATERRGAFEIPLVGPTLAEIPIKTFRERRHIFDENRRKRDSVPPPDWARK